MLSRSSSSSKKTNESIACYKNETYILPELCVELLDVCVEPELLWEKDSGSLGIWLGSIFIWSPRRGTYRKQNKETVNHYQQLSYQCAHRMCGGSSICPCFLNEKDVEVIFTC